MKYSIISVTEENENGTVSGYWNGDVIGDEIAAVRKARELSRINNGKRVAVVEVVNSTTPALIGIRGVQPIKIIASINKNLEVCR